MCGEIPYPHTHFLSRLNSWGFLQPLPGQKKQTRSAPRFSAALRPSVAPRLSAAVAGFHTAPRLLCCYPCCWAWCGPWAALLPLLPGMPLLPCSTTTALKVGMKRCPLCFCRVLFYWGEYYLWENNFLMISDFSANLGMVNQVYKKKLFSQVIPNPQIWIYTDGATLRK